MDWPGNYSWVSSGWRLTRLATGRVRPVSGPTVLRTVLRLTAATPQSVAGSVCLNQALLTLYIVTAGAFYAIVSTVPQCWHPRVPSVEIMGWRLLFRSIRDRFPGISKPFQEKIWNRQHVADLRRSLIPLFFFFSCSIWARVLKGLNWAFLNFFWSHKTTNFIARINCPMPPIIYQ